MKTASTTIRLDLPDTATTSVHHVRPADELSFEARMARYDVCQDCPLRVGLTCTRAAVRIFHLCGDAHAVCPAGRW